MIKLFGDEEGNGEQLLTWTKRSRTRWMPDECSRWSEMPFCMVTDDNVRPNISQKLQENAISTVPQKVKNYTKRVTREHMICYLPKLYELSGSFFRSLHFGKQTRKKKLERCHKIRST